MGSSARSDDLKHGLGLGRLTNGEQIVECAVAADEAGWDGVFLMDHLIDPVASSADEHRPFYDPWIALAGIATRTESITLGAGVTPIPRRQPWQLARDLATLDRLSDGRVLLGAGLGAPWEYESFGREYNQKRLAREYEEALDVITGLWSGDSFSYDGEYNSIDQAVMRPTPVQEPRIPLVIGGWWPFKGPFRRGARWDGIFPNWPSMHCQSPVLEKLPQHMRAVVPAEPSHEEDVTQMLSYYHDLTEDPGEIILTTGLRTVPADFVETCRDLGATWLRHGVVDPGLEHEENLQRIREGPPT
jgi:alkanesulfonate monooxygenase SsuD/methylene tetrahydromethanopterin reductase-like flavin-dependent oxidoreductase (luciferase family)